jgi:hypothetical protein
VEFSPLLNEARALLAAAKADPSAALQVEKRLLELKLKLDEAANALEWPALVAEARDWIGWLAKTVEENGNDQQKQKAADLAREVEQSIQERKADRLRKRVEQIVRLYYDILMAQPSWWVYQFQQAEKDQDKMKDAERAEHLLEQGRLCITKNNFTGLQNVVRQLWDLLPDKAVEEAKRGYGATLMRG